MADSCRCDISNPRCCACTCGLQLKKEKDRLEKDMAQVKATMETTVKSLKASNTKLSEEKLKAELQGKALKKRCEAEAVGVCRIPPDVV